MIDDGALKRLDMADKITLVCFSYYVYIQLKAERNYVRLLLNIVMCTIQLLITIRQTDNKIRG